MPLVLVKKDKEKYPDTDVYLKNLVNVLGGFVAHVLTVPRTEGELTARDVEVYVSDFGPLDVHSKDLEIVIFANDYPQRRENLDERRDKLIRDITGYSPIRNAFVWINLITGSFNSF